VVVVPPAGVVASLELVAPVVGEPASLDWLALLEALLDPP
jgi:hypothetical protein